MMSAILLRDKLSQSAFAGCMSQEQSEQVLELRPPVFGEDKVASQARTLFSDISMRKMGVVKKRMRR